MVTINYRRCEKKRKERPEKELEEETCAEDQQSVRTMVTAATNMPRWQSRNMKSARRKRKDRRRR
jgi:hypothetical protein